MTGEAVTLEKGQRRRRLQRPGDFEDLEEETGLNRRGPREQTGRLEELALVTFSKAVLGSGKKSIEK